MTSLPRTETGKSQCFELRRIAAESAAGKLASYGEWIVREPDRAVAALSMKRCGHMIVTQCSNERGGLPMKHRENEMPLLSPGRFIDSDAPPIADFAHDVTAGLRREKDRVLRLYRAVRDGIVYDPYVDFSDPTNFRASNVLAAGRGFCVGKSALLAAVARAIGVPARVGYADVRNHLTSPRLYERIKTDVFIWHSYADLYVCGRWVKATPAFDSALCERLGLKPLEFDGRRDSLFHPFDRDGRRHMEYLRDRGTFPDVPFEAIQADFRHAYPSLMTAARLRGDFRCEAIAAGSGQQGSGSED